MKIKKNVAIKISLLVSTILSLSLVIHSSYNIPTPAKAEGIPFGQNVWTWGDNTYGQLGTGSSSSNSNVPVAVSSFSSNISFVGAAYNTDYAVTSTGDVYAWGSNSNGELGIGSQDTNVHNTPVQVHNISNVIAISGSLTSPHVLALKSDGTVWSWGKNDTGIGATDPSCSGCNATPFQIFGLLNIKAVSAGYTTDYALKGDGTVWAWGSNNYAEFGIGSNDSSQHPPTEVSGLTNIKQIVANYRVLEALNTNGTVYEWGDDSGSQLGSALASSTCTVGGTNYTCVKTPQQVPSLNNIIEVGNYYYSYSGGYVNSDAIGEGGNEYWWAANNTTPSIGSSGNAEYIGANGFMFYRQLDGTVVSYGLNGDGQLGNGNYTSWPGSHTRVGSLTNVSGVAGGKNNGIALAAN